MENLKEEVVSLCAKSIIARKLTKEIDEKLDEILNRLMKKYE